MSESAQDGIAIAESVETLWGVHLQVAGCARCGQAHLVESSRMGMPCPNCGSAPLEAQPARLRPEPPEMLIPFSKNRSELGIMLSNYIKPVWLRPDDLSPEALLRRATPVYWPLWLVDSDLTGDWQAEMGFDYQVKSSQELYRSGGWQTREVVETRIRWEPRLGQIDRHYDNVVVPAASDHAGLSDRVGGYAQGTAVRYDPTRLGQAALRIPDETPREALPMAQAALNKAASLECQQAAGAQHLRNYTIHAEYRHLHWTQLLLPLYATYYTTDDGQRQVILVNGQTGMVGGPRLASQRKGWLWGGCSLAVGLIIFILGVICGLAAALVPPLALLSPLLILLALAIGGFALIPVAWPWQWNRKQLKRSDL
jgi:hypothetical protein